MLNRKVVKNKLTKPKKTNVTDSGYGVRKEAGIREWDLKLQPENTDQKSGMLK